MGPRTFRRVRGCGQERRLTRLRDRAPLRVLHIDSGETWRGGQRQVLLLATALVQTGNTSIVACPPGTRLAALSAAGGLTTIAFRPASDIDVRSGLQIRRAVNAHRVDVVHAHDARSHAVALLALVGLRTPLVVTRRVTFPPRNRLKYGRRVAHFIAISRAVRDSLVAAGVPAERISIVYSGVPSPVSTRPIDWRTRLGRNAETIICGVVGAMTAEKGVGALEEIGSLLPDAVAQRVAVVLIGGAGPERVDRLGRLFVFHAGFVDDVGAAVSGLDMVWHPSTAEGLGTALLDAMSHGVPPIAYAVGGIPEIIEHEASGLLVRSGDRRAFADAIARLATDPSLRSRLGEGAVRRAAGFSVAGMTAGALEVYDKVAGRH